VQTNDLPWRSTWYRHSGWYNCRVSGNPKSDAEFIDSASKRSKHCLDQLRLYKRKVASSHSLPMRKRKAIIDLKPPSVPIDRMFIDTMLCLPVNAKQRSRRGGTFHHSTGTIPLYLSSVDYLADGLTFPQTRKDPVAEPLPQCARPDFKDRTIWRLGYFNGVVSYKRENACNWRACVNKLRRMFGRDICRDATFQFVLRCITVGGLSPDQFESLMRIRDQFRRRRASYRESICRFLFCTYNKQVRFVAASLASTFPTPAKITGLSTSARK
jgi:hypothetical protein